MWTQRISAVALAAFCLAAAPVAAQQAEVEVTRIGQYPTMPRLVVVQPVRDWCTQLELSAGIERDKCGTMQLHEVVQMLIENSSD